MALFPCITGGATTGAVIIYDTQTELSATTETNIPITGSSDYEYLIPLFKLPTIPTTGQYSNAYCSIPVDKTNTATVGYIFTNGGRSYEFKRSGDNLIYKLSNASLGATLMGVLATNDANIAALYA